MKNKLNAEATIRLTAAILGVSVAAVRRQLVGKSLWVAARRA
jgi:hypothetical protein